MNLGMTGAIGGFGQGLTQAAQMSNANQMEAYKLQVEQDMRERAAERMAQRGAQAKIAERAGNMADAQTVNVLYQGKVSGDQAQTINSANGSSVTPEEVATANAGNPLNTAQQAAYGINPVARSDELADKATIAIAKTGNVDLAKELTAQQQIEINKDNADTKRELAAVKAEKEAVEKGKKDFAFAEEYETWKRTYPKGAKGSDDLSYNAFLRVKSNYLLKQAGLIQKAGAQIELNPEGADKIRAELSGESDAPSKVIDAKDYFKK